MKEITESPEDLIKREMKQFTKDIGKLEYFAEDQMKVKGANYKIEVKDINFEGAVSKLIREMIEGKYPSSRKMDSHYLFYPE